jgi:hypothetical protein
LKNALFERMSTVVYTGSSLLKERDERGEGVGVN